MVDWKASVKSPFYVTIFGGGVTGLTAAHELVERGFRVQVWEPQSDDRFPARGCDVGGLARTQWTRAHWPEWVDASHEPVPRVGLVRRAEDSQADRRLLVDQSREALDLVAGPTLDDGLLHGAERPGGLPRRRDTGLGSNLSQRGVELRLQRGLQRVEVLAARHPAFEQYQARIQLLAGMDGDFIRNRLFEPFASTKPGGFGIGAFEARSLITAMGGRLSVDSRLGRGTTFTILLPSAEAESEPSRKRA